jgi:hypothetical protein
MDSVYAEIDVPVLVIIGKKVKQVNRKADSSAVEDISQRKEHIMVTYPESANHVPQHNHTTSHV